MDTLEASVKVSVFLEIRRFIYHSNTQTFVKLIIQRVSLATEPGWLANRCYVSQQLGALQTHTTDTFLFISHTTNVLLFKFRCNIFIGVRIIKEMQGSVASGTHCMFVEDAVSL